MVNGRADKNNQLIHSLLGHVQEVERLAYLNDDVSEDKRGRGFCGAEERKHSGRNFLSTHSRGSVELLW